MSTTLKIAYAASVALTLTKATMASSATVGRESTAIVNTSNLYDDIALTVRLTANGTPTANTFAYVFAYLSEDGTNYTDNATGSDADLTLKSPTNLVLIGQGAWAAASNYQLNIVIPSLVAKLGAIPPKWGIFVVQSSGVALSALSASYTGITYTNG
jgi:hypothetical protein